MRITVLVDNITTTRNLKAEAGFSLYIENNAANILFDTGASSLFIENAMQLDINLLKANYIVLSHGHYDHTWGLKHLLNLYATANERPITKPVILTHPLTFSRRIKGNKEMGINVTEENLIHCFNIHKSSAPIWINDQLVFLGEINRKFNFEGTHTIGQIIKNNLSEADIMQDDTALAYKNSQGLVIITGCSHSGICNIVEQAKQICKDNRILAIIGGLHLRKPSVEQINGTTAYLNNAAVEKIYACHCTDQASRIALAQLGNICEITTGSTLDFS